MPEHRGGGGGGLCGVAGSGGGTRPREGEDLGFGSESNKYPLMGFNHKSDIKGLWPLRRMDWRGRQGASETSQEAATVV